MNRLTLGSLFDGIGGWLLAATHAEVEPIWASEIDPYPASVTAKHFPNVKQLGDITKLNGAELEPVDIICAGSPCQDLSISGKREGLAGERSGLFYAAIKLVRDMRKATNGKYPKFFVWENVMGAFSSNKGLDFKAVLEEITEAEIPMPSSGRWATAGVVRNRECYLEWRVLDAQYWGVPQRRKRIFLVADFIGGGRGEILFEPTSLRGNPTESNNKEENITTPARENIDATVYENHANDSRVTERKKVADTLTQRMGTGGGNVPFKIDATKRQSNICSE